MENNLEEQYIEFIYCLWRGKLEESRFNLQPNNVKYTNYRDEAVTEYLYNPLFRKLYDLNKIMCEQIIQSKDNIRRQSVRRQYRKTMRDIN